MTRKYGTRHFMAWIAGCLSLVLIVLIWNHEFLIGKLLDYRLNEVINNDPQSLYHFSIGKVRINGWKGDVEMNNFQIQPRKNFVDSLSLTGSFKKTLVVGKLGQFSISDLRIYRFIMTGKLSMDSIIISGAEVTLLTNKKAIPEEKTSVALDIFNENLKELSVRHLNLANSSFRLVDCTTDTIILMEAPEINFGISNFYTNTTILSRNTGYETGRVQASIHSFNTSILSGYHIHTDSILFDSKPNRLVIIGIEMNPDPDKIQSENYLHLKKGDLILSGLDYKALIINNEVRINRFEINGPEFSFVKPFEKIKKIVTRVLPATTFRSIPLLLSIDTLHIRTGVFEYIKHGYQEPKIHLLATHISLDGLYFCTNPEKMDKPKTFYITGSTRFMDVTPLELRFRFPLDSQNNPFHIQGKMRELEATNLNKIIKNVAFVMVKSGHIHSMDFQINGNDTLATGNLKMDYTNMKLQAVKVNEKDFTETRNRGFMTFVLNTVVNSKNDPTKNSYSEGVIQVSRDSTKTFLDYNLECLMTGLLTCMVPESKTFLGNQKKSKK